MDCLWVSFICLLLLSSHPKLSVVSVVFDFNASLNDATPLSSIQLTVVYKRMKKIWLLKSANYMLYLLCSPLRLSLISAVFDFNASLNDVAPVSPNLLTVDLMRMGKG